MSSSMHRERCVTDLAPKRVVVPLMATVGINNKVVFLEKTGYVWEPIRSHVLIF